MSSTSGGAITGEHGIGLAKKRWWPQAVSPESMALHQTIKRALDPAGNFESGEIPLVPSLDERRTTDRQTASLRTVDPILAATFFSWSSLRGRAFLRFRVQPVERCCLGF